MTGTNPATFPHVAGALRLEMPRDEMAFRDRYEQLLLNRTLTTVFRPGDRRCPNWRGYEVGETVTARVIVQPGSDALGIAPEFSALRIPIRILELDVNDPNALRPLDFVGSSPDVFDQASLLSHLADIYDQPLSAYGDIVTRIHFSYLNEA